MIDHKHDFREIKNNNNKYNNNNNCYYRPVAELHLTEVYNIVFN